MPLQWAGPWRSFCACGFVTDWMNNPFRAQLAGERHIPQCPYYLRAKLILLGKTEVPLSKDGSMEKYFGEGASFLKADDVKEGQKFVIEKFDEAVTDIGLRPLLRLKGNSKPLGLNKTNYKKLREKFGKDETKWAGKQITLKIVIANNPTTRQEGPAIRIA
jgi:hypothetical protein